jgi:hypothetical protein
MAKKKGFKKGDRVKWKLGKGANTSKGTYLKKCTEVPLGPKKVVENLKTTKALGDSLAFESALVELSDGTYRLIKLGALVAA